MMIVAGIEVERYGRMKFLSLLNVEYRKAIKENDVMKSSEISAYMRRHEPDMCWNCFVNEKHELKFNHKSVKCRSCPKCCSVSS